MFALFVCGFVTTILEIACIDPHQTGFVGKGSDHLQLLKFWPARRGKNFGSALLQPARSVCVTSERFFHYRGYEQIDTCYVSQGSAMTLIRRGGLFGHCFVANSFRHPRAKIIVIERDLTKLLIK